MLNNIEILSRVIMDDTSREASWYHPLQPAPGEGSHPDGPFGGKRFDGAGQMGVAHLQERVAFPGRQLVRREISDVSVFYTASRTVLIL